MSIKINGTDVINDSRKGIFQSANVGSFANPARPGSASVGDLIWSTTDNQLQVWNGSSWVKATGDGATISASGGSEFTPGNGTKVHVFTGPGTFTLSNAALVEYAVLAGGAGGGSGSQAGGGGSGGLVMGTSTWAAGSYSITVGSGGGGGSNGSPSSVSGPSGTFTATGGGAGATTNNNGSPGGSGGGAGGGLQFPATPFPNQPNVTYTGGSGTSGQGFPGGGSNRTYIGAGGGSGDQGLGYTVSIPSYFVEANFQSAGNIGGPGIGFDWGLPTSYGDPRTNRSSNTTYRWFGGGGAGSWGTTYSAMGGGGGGPTSSGQANTGGGGRAGSGGGSGIVIIRYALIQ